jgi:hypothetical protein
MTPNDRAHASTPAPPEDGQNRLLTADDLAERWKVPVTQVYRQSRESDLPTVRIGKYYRYRLEAVEQWERASEDGSADG